MLALKPEHLVYDVTETVNAQSTQRPYRGLLKKHPGKMIYLVCDNARYNRCGWLQVWAARQRIRLVLLPPYSPDLNLIERFWCLLRKPAINYATYDEFRKGIVQFMDNAKAYNKEIRSLLTLNFQTIGNASFNFTQTNS